MIQHRQVDDQISANCPDFPPTCKQLADIRVYMQTFFLLSWGGEGSLGDARILSTLITDTLTVCTFYVSTICVCTTTVIVYMNPKT